MKILKLDPQKIKSEYPKSYETIKSWIKKVSIETVNLQGKDLKDYEEQLQNTVDDEYIDTILEFTPRTLYDFFDAQKVLIGIQFLLEDKIAGSVNAEVLTQWFNQRVDAESYTFYTAFKKLEDGI